MHPLAAFGIVLALVAVATVLGLLWRRRQGVVAAVAGPATDADGTAWVIRPADVAASGPFGAHATLVQFSTDFCAKCPGTRRLLGAVAESRPGVVHLDVDLTRRADLANRFNIFQTPTTLVLDGSGRIRARVGGVPDRGQLTKQLDELLVHRTTGE
jgi:thiol-disulfide isomerase/thioredoxin